MIAAQVVAYASVLIAVVIADALFGRRRPESSTPVAKLTDDLMVLASAGALVAGIVGSFAVDPAPIGPSAAAIAAGVISSVAGLALRVSAMRTLGRHYTLTPGIAADQSVITSGPYRFVRHPGYAGLLLVIAGLQMIVGTWIAVLSVALVAATVPVRIWAEERMLVSHFGERYLEYRGRTPFRLLPGLF